MNKKTARRRSVKQIRRSNNKTVIRSIKKRRRSNNKKTVRRSIKKRRRSNERNDGNWDRPDVGTVVGTPVPDPVVGTVVGTPVPDPVVGTVVRSSDNNDKLVKSILEEQEKYSEYLLSHYQEGFKHCQSGNLEKIENYIEALSNKFNEWKNSECEFFDLKSYKMHFDFKLRYTLRKCNGEKKNRVALNIMRIGFFNVDSHLKTLLTTMFTDDEKENKRIIKEFNERDEIKFDMECNIFIRVINLFIEKIDDGQVLYLENVFNACWQQVLESMGFKKCNNGNDYYLIKEAKNNDDYVIKLQNLL